MKAIVWKLVVAVGVGLMAYWWCISSGAYDRPVLFGIVGGVSTAVALLWSDPP